MATEGRSSSEGDADVNQNVRTFQRRSTYTSMVKVVKMMEITVQDLTCRFLVAPNRPFLRLCLREDSN